MHRSAALVFSLGLLAACGIDSEPESPTPSPQASPVPARVAPPDELAESLVDLVPEPELREAPPSAGVHVRVVGGAGFPIAARKAGGGMLEEEPVEESADAGDDDWDDAAAPVKKNQQA